MNSAWRKLWPSCVPERDFEGFETNALAADVEENAIVEEIIFLGNSMVSEVVSEDVEELVQDYCTELTTQELVYIQNEQQKNLAEEQSSKDEEKTEESIPSASIKDICGKWGDLQAFMKKYHPDTLVANKSVNLFNDNVMSRFRKILQRRQKQQILDKFLIKEKRKEIQKKNLPESKRQKIEEIPLELPEVFMEGDSSTKK